MSRKRSKYKPKPIRFDTLSYVVSGMKKFDEVSVAVNVRIRNHDALEALRLGKAKREDIDILIGAFNMAEGFMRLRDEFGKDWTAEIRAGQDALLTVARRGLERGSFVCRAEELKAILMLMELHDAQLDQATVKDMEQALNVIAEDVRTKRARPIKEKT